MRDKMCDGFVTTFRRHKCDALCVYRAKMPKRSPEFGASDGTVYAASSDGKEEEHRRFGLDGIDDDGGRGPAQKSFPVRRIRLRRRRTKAVEEPSLEAKEETRRPRTGRRMGATGSGGKKRGRLRLFRVRSVERSSESEQLYRRGVTESHDLRAPERGVKGYVTMNVLVFDDELRECERLIRACAKNGVDAMIVQDVGAARLVKRVAPNMAVHGSTQMSITDANGALFAKEIGCERVVVGRELSISEIKTVVDKSPETTVEAFTHGALCVSYSGQCFSSEAWGGGPLIEANARKRVECRTDLW